MNAFDLALKGLTPEPLSRYLCALAVFRVVAEQVDSQARAYWDEASFHLVSCLEREELLNFFVNRYQPTPIVAPWNGGSGFYEGDSRVGMEAILAGQNPRFAVYGEVIRQIKSWEEMPKTYNRVGDVTSTLEEAIGKSGEGQEKNKLLQLLEDITAMGGRALKHFEAADMADIELRVLENKSKSEKGEVKKQITRWWSSVKKSRTKCNELSRGGSKRRLQEKSRSSLPDAVLPWLDTTYVLGLDDSPSYSPLLGTGGNEGKLDFSNNFMQRLAELLLSGNDERTWKLLASLLFDEVIDGLGQAKIGQYNPGRAGGFN